MLVVEQLKFSNHISFLQAFRGLAGSFVNLCLRSLCLRACNYCLRSNTTEIKAQNECCENKSPRAVTHDHAQDADGVWVKKRAGKDSKYCKTVCVFVCEICLKWPCVSSSLEGSRSCVETRPVSSLCSCCSVMLLALNTQTHSSMLTAGTTPHGNSWTFVKHCVCFVFCFFLSTFGFKDGSSRKGYGQTSALCL